jgi:hypothetical protein
MATYRLSSLLIAVAAVAVVFALGRSLGLLVATISIPVIVFISTDRYLHPWWWRKVIGWAGAVIAALLLFLVATVFLAEPSRYRPPMTWQQELVKSLPFLVVESMVFGSLLAAAGLVAVRCIDWLGSRKKP